MPDCFWTKFELLSILETNLKKKYLIENSPFFENWKLSDLEPILGRVVWFHKNQNSAVLRQKSQFCVKNSANFRFFQRKKQDFRRKTCLKCGKYFVQILNKKMKSYDRNYDGGWFLSWLSKMYLNVPWGHCVRRFITGRFMST